MVWDFLDELFDDSWGDGTEEFRGRKANKLQELAKDMNDVTQAAVCEPMYSEYSIIAQYVIPRAIKLHGKTQLRCNEQGQESAGQLLKRIIKSGANKRRRASEFYRRKKLSTGETVLIKCNFTETCTVTSIATFRLRMDLIGKGKSRLHAKQRAGHKQGQLKN